MDQYIGRLLDDRYEILEIIGTGGMAVVYKARDHRLNRLVAVKILKDEFARDEEFRRRFRAEGEAEAIMKVQTALADSIKLLNSANPNDQVVKIKALESFEKAADGQATKIIVPSEIQSLAGLAASFKGLLEEK